MAGSTIEAASRRPIALANIHQGTARHLVKTAFAEINRDRAKIFSPQNNNWSIDAAKHEIATHRVALACDHAGRDAIRFVAQVLQELRVQVRDFAPSAPFEGKLDFPVWIAPAMQILEDKMCDRAILACGTGIGMTIMANRWPGHYAALAHDHVTTALSREHNNIDIMAFGQQQIVARRTSLKDVVKSVIVFLSTSFITDPARYGQRIRQIDQLARLHIPLGYCPGLADVLLVKAQEAALRQDYAVARGFLAEYLRDGGESENYYDFLGSFRELVQSADPQNSDVQSMVALIDIALNP